VAEELGFVPQAVDPPHQAVAHPEHVRYLLEVLAQQLIPAQGARGVRGAQPRRGLHEKERKGRRLYLSRAK